MIFHENRLPAADDSHEISCLICYLKKKQILKLSSAANYRWHFMCKTVFFSYRLPLCIWSDVFPVRWQKSNSKQSQSWCEKWINREKTLSPIVVETPNCPCTLTLAENDPGHFHTDPDCDKTKHNSRTNCIYNKNAQQCMQRNLKRYVLRNRSALAVNC